MTIALLVGIVARLINSIQEQSMIDWTLAQVAFERDDAYTAELLRVYGPALAPTRRYQHEKHTDRRLVAARKAKLAADAAMRGETK